MPSQTDYGPGQSELQGSLEGLRATLAAIGAMVGSVALTASAAAQVSVENQREAWQAFQSIEQALQSVEDGGHHHGPHFRVVDVAPDIANAFVDHAILPHRLALDVMIDVRASAQLAGLLLSFGGYYLQESITLRVAGVRGAAEVTLVSGASMFDLQRAIETVHPLTGVAPNFAGPGVLVTSDECGSDQFVSVRLVHPTHAPGASGIYRQDAHDFFRTDPASRVPWDAKQAFSGVWDYGQDVQAFVNGHPAYGQGLSLVVWSPQLRLRTTLQVIQDPWPGHGFTLGTFRAFRILRD